MHSDTSHCRSLLLFLFATVIIACICASSSVQATGADDDETYFITRIAGTGSGTLRVNVPALEASLSGVGGIAQSRNGDLFASLRTSHVVLKLEFDKQGGTWSNVEIIAGTGTKGTGADGVLGTECTLDTPGGLSLIEDGSTGEVTAVLFADWSNHRVRQLDMSTRMITTIAGNGEMGFSGDGGSATVAKLFNPISAYYDKSNGDIYIADTNNNRIRRVSGGTISTVVGKTCTSSDGLGDGGPAVDACLKGSYQFTMNDAGEWLIIDYTNNRIRKVDLHGIITTVAGGGTETGDALATSVRLSNIWGISLISSGELLAADNGKSAIRKMDSSGFMRVIAGGGSKNPSSKPPIPAKTASIKPLAVTYARDGSDAIFIGDSRGYIFKLTGLLCYGVAFDNAAVCSGHGNCTGIDECKCDSGWMGIDCSVVTECFDIKFNDKSVCSGHGSCVKTDGCECDDGWMGLDCSITHCFGVTSNLSGACSGKGKCIKPNKCQCDDGFKGHKCHMKARD